MSILRELPYILEEAVRRNALVEPRRFSLAEAWRGDCDPQDHRIFRGDNLGLMKYLAMQQGGPGSIQMIYCDPPFFTGADYDAVVEVGGSRVRHPAYRDTWTEGLSEYLIRLSQALLLMRQLLAEDGLMWLHLDWHASHYARVLMDEIFGEDRFVNEIIWEYKSGGSTRKRFARKHDNILVYSKGRSFRFHPLKEKSYNRGLKPYRFKGVEEFCDEVGWYTLVNMKDVWQLDMVGRTSGERTGYATQKPEKLLERILACCTDPGDLAADFFCGSGTLGAAAAGMGRRSLQCDREQLAAETSLARISGAGRGACLYAEGNYAESRDPEGKAGERRAFRVVMQAKEPAAGRMDRPAETPDGDGLRTISLEAIEDFLRPAGLDSKSAKALEEALAEDPRNAVSCWAIDPAFDGEVFRPQHVMRRSRQGLETVCEVHAAPGAALVKVVDVMGRAEVFRV